jgi:hypothetical protein
MGARFSAGFASALARNKQEGPCIPTQDLSRGIQILSSTSTRFLKGQSQNLEQSQGTTFPAGIVTHAPRALQSQQGM